MKTSKSPISAKVAMTQKALTRMQHSAVATHGIGTPKGSHIAKLQATLDKDNYMKGKK